MRENIIYHIALLEDFNTFRKGNSYTPAEFDKDGFIHCTKGVSLSLMVLEDYFQNVEEEIILLEIDCDKVEVEIKFEDAKPAKNAGKKHLEEGAVFPHIYGPLNLDAVTGVGLVRKSGGKFLWPERFQPLDRLLEEREPQMDTDNHG